MGYVSQALSFSMFWCVYVISTLSPSVSLPVWVWWQQACPQNRGVGDNSLSLLSKMLKYREFYPPLSNICFWIENLVLNQTREAEGCFFLTSGTWGLQLEIESSRSAYLDSIIYQHPRLKNHLGGRPLGVSVGDYLYCANWGEDTVHCGWHQSLAVTLGCEGGERGQSNGVYSSLSPPPCSCNETAASSAITLTSPPCSTALLNYELK